MENKLTIYLDSRQLDRYSSYDITINDNSYFCRSNIKNYITRINYDKDITYYYTIIIKDIIISDDIVNNLLNTTSKEEYNLLIECIIKKYGDSNL